jgi:hypothetical protein
MRRRKAIKIEVVSGNYGHADLMFDPNVKSFFGVIEGETFRANTASECSNILFKRLSIQPNRQWQKFIFVNSNDTEMHHWDDPVPMDGAVASFEFYRMEIATDSSGEFYRRWLNDDEDPGVERHAFRLLKRHAVWHQIPYSAEAWQSLVALRDLLNAANKKLSDLLHSPDAKALLEQRSVRLLSAPEPEVYRAPEIHGGPRP